MKKRLIALMVAGLIAAGTMSGCSNDEGAENMEEGQLSFEFNYDDMNVVLNEKGKYVLHKGDVSFAYYQSGFGYINYSASPNLAKMELNCGNHLYSGGDYTLHEDMPAENMYDEICEDCFSK